MTSGVFYLALRPLGHGAGADDPPQQGRKTDKRESAGFLPSQPRVCSFHHDDGLGSIRALAWQKHEDEMGRYDARARVQTCIYSQTAEATRGPLSAAICLMANTCRYRCSSRNLWGVQRCARRGAVRSRRRRVWETAKCRRHRRWNVHSGVMCRLDPLVIFMEQPLVPRQEQILGGKHRFELFGS